MFSSCPAKAFARCRSDGRAHSEGAAKGQPLATNGGTDDEHGSFAPTPVENRPIMTNRTPMMFAPALALIALASCGSSKHAANNIQAGGAAMDSATLAKIDLTTQPFKNGQSIPY